MMDLHYLAYKLATRFNQPNGVWKPYNKKKSHNFEIISEILKYKYIFDNKCFTF